MSASPAPHLPPTLVVDLPTTSDHFKSDTDSENNSFITFHQSSFFNQSEFSFPSNSTSLNSPEPPFLPHNMSSAPDISFHNYISLSLVWKRCLNKLIYWQNYVAPNPAEINQHDSLSLGSYTSPLSPSWTFNKSSTLSIEKNTLKAEYNDSLSQAPISPSRLYTNNSSAISNPLLIDKNTPNLSLQTSNDPTAYGSIDHDHSPSPNPSLNITDVPQNFQAPPSSLNSPISTLPLVSISTTHSTLPDISPTTKSTLPDPHILPHFFSVTNSDKHQPITSYIDSIHSMATKNGFSRISACLEKKVLFLSFERPLAKRLIFILITTISFFILCSFSFLHYGDEPKNCRMSFMSPSYIHLSGFNKNHTRFHSKYSLHLYRETNVDDLKTLTGIPVLFIPGNAGSFRQVRALASRSTLHQDEKPIDTQFSSNQIDHQFDYFTAHFNEDLTAFHGRSLLNQAEYLNDAIKYILSLYNTSTPNLFHNSSHLFGKENSSANSNPNKQHPVSKSNSTKKHPLPQSVILIGHSMGGIVARVMFLLDNYQKNSINTIFTLSAPHTLSPVPFDKEIVSIYDRVNSYWETSFSQDLIGKNPLAQVSLISISGGSLDKTIASEYTPVSSFIPPSNGFTVFTSSIPHVWSSIDHQAIVWCDQFRKVFATVMAEIADITVPSKTKPLPARMNVFRKRLLGGFQISAVPQYLQTRYHPSLGAGSPELGNGIGNKVAKKSTDLARFPLLMQNHISRKTPILDDFHGKSNALDSKSHSSSTQTTIKSPLKSGSFIPPAVGNHDTLLWIEDSSKLSSPATDRLAIRKLGEFATGPYDVSGKAYFMSIPSDLSSDINKDTEFTFVTNNVLIPYEVIPPPSHHESFVTSENSTLNTSENIRNQIPYNFKSGKTKAGIYALVCRYPHAKLKHSDNNLNVIDLTKKSDIIFKKSNKHVTAKSLIGLLCKNIADDVSILPNPNQVARLPHDDENDGRLTESSLYKIPRTNVGHMSYIKYDAVQLAEYDFITIIDTNTEPISGFAAAEFSTKRQSRINFETKSWWNLAFSGAQLLLPSNRPFMMDVSFPHIWSSLLSYKIKIQDPEQCQNLRTSSIMLRNELNHNADEDPSKMFKTFIRQYSGDSYESKYYLDVGINSTLPINMANVAPFSPFSVREYDSDFESNLYYYGQKSHYYHNLHLQFWSDSLHHSSFNSSFSNVSEEIKMLIKLDLISSLGNLLTHYRMAIVCFPVAIFSAVLLIQFYIYNTRQVFISAEHALSIFVKRYSGCFIFISLVFPYLAHLEFFRNILYFFEPGMDVYSGDGPASIFTIVRRNQFFMGLEPGHLPFLGTFLMFTGVGLSVATIIVLRALIWTCYILSIGVSTATQFSVSVIFRNSKDRLNSSPRNITIKKSITCIATKKEIEKEIQNELTVHQTLCPSTVKWSTMPFAIFQQTVFTTFLLIAMANDLPCEIVYLVSFLIQLATTVAAYFPLSCGHSVMVNSCGETISVSCFFNFCFSLLLIMFWIVPIAAPILIVWTRELVAGWNEPLQSNYNIFSICVVLLLVETISCGKMVPHTKSPFNQAVTYLALAYFSGCTMFMGMQRTYLLYQLINAFFAWLLVLFVIKASLVWKRRIRIPKNFSKLLENEDEYDQDLTGYNGYETSTDEGEKSNCNLVKVNSGYHDHRNQSKRSKGTHIYANRVDEPQTNEEFSVHESILSSPAQLSFIIETPHDSMSNRSGLLSTPKTNVSRNRNDMKVQTSSKNVPIHLKTCQQNHNAYSYNCNNTTTFTNNITQNTNT